MVGGNLSDEKAQSNFRIKLALGGTIQRTRGALSEHGLQLTGKAEALQSSLALNSKLKFPVMIWPRRTEELQNCKCSESQRGILTY